jgi:uncharacterized tellurite resistance protein B-like protein
MQSPNRWETLRKEILADGVIDAEEVQRLRSLLYEDGQIDREEADFLFALNDISTGSEGHDSTWTDLFVEALTDFVLKDEESPGVIDVSEAMYLIQKIGADGIVDHNEIQLLINITQKAVGESPEPFSEFVLEVLEQKVIADGVVDAEEVGYLRMVMYGDGGLEGFSISREEAGILFSINNATSANEGHHPSWQEFFVEAIASCVLDDQNSFGEVDAEEAEWLVSQIQSDGLLDSNEMALLQFLNSKTPLQHPTLKQWLELVEEA